VGSYDFVDGLGVLGEDIVEDLIQIVFLGGKVFVILLDAINESLGDDLALPGCEVDGLGGVLDGTVVVGQQVRELCQIDLGGGLAGEAVEPAPPALEFFLVGLGTVFGDRSACEGFEGTRP
jgi:hypothetical protein